MVGSLPMSDPLRELGQGLRRAWLERDVPALRRGLVELARSCGYNTLGLARALSITPRQLQRISSVVMGCAPREWLNELRLLDAHRMLSNAHTVKEVAYALGFSNASQLSRTFKQRFGETPSAVIALGPSPLQKDPSPLLPRALDAALWDGFAQK
jgi:AraC-like DNA-binding protein